MNTPKWIQRLMSGIRSSLFRTTGVEVSVSVEPPDDIEPTDEQVQRVSRVFDEAQAVGDELRRLREQVLSQQAVIDAVDHELRCAGFIDDTVKAVKQVVRQRDMLMLAARHEGQKNAVAIGRTAHGIIVDDPVPTIADGDIRRVKGTPVPCWFPHSEFCNWGAFVRYIEPWSPEYGRVCVVRRECSPTTYVDHFYYIDQYDTFGAFGRGPYLTQQEATRAQFLEPVFPGRKAV